LLVERQAAACRHRAPTCGASLRARFPPRSLRRAPSRSKRHYPGAPCPRAAPPLARQQRVGCHGRRPHA
jgi:hypothetical protein